MQNEINETITSTVQDAIRNARETLLPELLTGNDVAAHLRINKRGVIKLVTDGQLAAVAVGREVRFTPEAVQEFIQRHTTPARLPMPERIAL